MTRQTKRLRAALTLALLASLSLSGGCLYRMQVQQGNVLDQTQVAQLKNGMTRSQVSYLLGTPMVPDAFDQERWDYYHYVDNGRGNGFDVKQTRRLTVWFKDGKVDRIEDSAGVANAAAPAATSTTPAAAPAAPASQPAG